MREISLHLMDIIQNSVEAKANLITVQIEENKRENILRITVSDNGCGISEEDLPRIKDPFTTSRTSRKVGLGLSLFEASCLRCRGDLIVKSKKGEGTEVTAFMEYDNIDRPPLGRVGDTILSSLLNPEVDIVYRHIVDEKVFIFDTREIKAVVGNDIAQPDILQWAKEYIDEGIESIGGLRF